MAQNSPFAAAIMQWQTDANAGNTTSIRKLYQTNAVALVTEGTDPPGMIQGADNIVTDLGQHFGPGKPYQNIQLVELAWQQHGNSGWSYGTWSATVKDPNTGNPTQQPGSWSVIWVQGSGTTPWLIQVFAVVPYVPGT